MFVVLVLFVFAFIGEFLFLCGDEGAESCLVPCVGCGAGWFFGLGCFPDCVGMRQATFLCPCYVGWVG